jgi:hypothetical protein
MSKPVGLFLVKKKFTEAAPVFFEFAASLGKQASRKGLSTGTLQHAFRISEMLAGIPPVRNWPHWYET